jgi:hypothetical protein
MASTGRERRKTAGLRMNSLVGQALEEDDAFWKHETWNDEDSGNDSFRDSDEDSDLKKDEFDSDFDDSETDNEAEEEAAGHAEEIELQKSERAGKQRKGNYVEASRPVVQQHKGGRRGRGGKRVMGEGFNAGIALNFPPPSALSPPALQQQPVMTVPSTSSVPFSAVYPPVQVSSIPQSATSAAAASATATTTAASAATEGSPLTMLPPGETSNAAAIPSPPSPIKSNRKSGDPVIPRSSLASARERRSTHGIRKLRENRSTPSSDKPLRGPTRANSSGAKRKRRYAQEELLLESVHQTESENLRWLLARKRTQDQHDKDHRDATAHLRDRQRGSKVIQRFHSRRGCLVTLTFPEMDAVPEILTRRRQPPAHEEQPQQHWPTEPPVESSSSSSLTKKQQVVCVITGKPARYKDPLTNYPYHDLVAFRELRRRHRLGISVEESSTNVAMETTLGALDCHLVSDSASSNTATFSAELTATKVNGGGKEAPGTKEAPGLKASKKRPAGLSNKTTLDTSKLFFQSPKPAPRPRTAGVGAQLEGSEFANSTALASSLTEKQDGIAAHLAFSWGGVAGDESAESPVSPSGRRLSRRKWKPSEKVLETIAMSPKKDGVISTPPGIRIKPLHQIRVCVGGSNGQALHMPCAPLAPIIASSPGLGPKIAVRAVQGSSVPPELDLKRSIPTNGSNGESSTEKTAKEKVAQEVGKSNDAICQSTPPKINVGASTSECSSSVSEPLANTVALVSTTASDSLPETGALKIPSPELHRQLQKLYEVPQNNSAGGSQESTHQYITQGDLIMEAIHNYTKQHEEEALRPPPELAQQSQNQEEQNILDNKEAQST